MVANYTPCERSVTSSLEGQRVAASRRRNSASASSGTSTWNGRMALPVCSATAVMAFSPSLGCGEVADRTRPGAHSGAVRASRTGPNLTPVNRGSGRDEGPFPACRHCESGMALSRHCWSSHPTARVPNGLLWDTPAPLPVCISGASVGGRGTRAFVVAASRHYAAGHPFQGGEQPADFLDLDSEDRLSLAHGAPDGAHQLEMAGPAARTPVVTPGTRRALSATRGGQSRWT